MNNDAGELRDRVEELEEALEKIANAYKNMTWRERLVGEPSPAKLVRIAAAALSGTASGADKEKEGVDADRPFKGEIIDFDKRLVIGGEEVGRPWLVIQHEDGTRDELGDWLRTYATEGMRISIELSAKEEG